jgi:DNA-binding transcriptional regulator YiaG
MNHIEYRYALDQLGLTQVAAAEFLGVNARTSRSWASGRSPIPRAVEMLLGLMIECGLSPDTVSHAAAKAIRSS